MSAEISDMRYLTHGQTYYFYATNIQGDIFRGYWDFSAKPEGSNAHVGRQYPNLPNTWKQAVFEPDMPGGYVIALTLEGNSGGNPVTVEKAFTVKNAPPNLQSKLVGRFTTLSDIGLQLDIADDPNGDEVSILWEIIEKPAGSDAAISNAGSKTATIRSTTLGEHWISVTLTDEWGGVAAREHRIDFYENRPPTAVVTQVPAFLDNTSVSFDASISRDLDDRPVGFAWEVTGSPAGSVAQLVSDGPVAELLDGGDGDYTVKLTVNDDALETVKEMEIHTVGRLHQLDSNIVDAKADTTSSKIVLLTDSPSIVVIDSEDELVLTEHALVLDEAPIAISISPDGSQAAVLHGSKVAIVDVATGNILNILQSSQLKLGEVVHGGNGYVYLFPADLGPYDRELRPLVSLEIASGAETLSSENYYYAVNTKLDAANDRVISTGRSFDISLGPLAVSDTGKQAAGRDPFVSDDFTLSIGEHGQVYSMPPAGSGGDPSFLGKLEENLNSTTYDNPHWIATEIEAIAFKASSGKMATLESAINSFTSTSFEPSYSHTVRVYDDTTFELLQEIGMPSVDVDGAPVTLVPRHLFFREATDELVVMAGLPEPGTPGKGWVLIY